MPNAPGTRQPVSNSSLLIMPHAPFTSPCRSCRGGRAQHITARSSSSDRHHCRSACGALSAGPNGRRLPVSVFVLRFRLGKSPSGLSACQLIWWAGLAAWARGPGTGLLFGRCPNPEDPGDQSAAMFLFSAIADRRRVPAFCVRRGNFYCVHSPRDLAT